ncbi:unnamed protein product [Lactuca virosa]|uniref:Uncharacterized protein n=1 Tax=Lactuca virosa TaxID=75947 RepID=A0AAU9PRH0_9ASTR|nr:unnamed protein product [Lactuca virosa]
MPRITNSNKITHAQCLIEKQIQEASSPNNHWTLIHKDFTRHLNKKKDAAAPYCVPSPSSASSPPQLRLLHHSTSGSASDDFCNDFYRHSLTSFIMD